MKKYFYLIFIIFILLVSVNKSAVAENNKLIYEDEDIYIRFILLTPEQIGSFYEGREFKKSAIKLLMQSCYVTVIIRNKTRDVLWLELDNWKYNSTGDESFKRQTREYWKQQWNDIGLSTAHQSTFGWTLLPDTRDLRPNESVGGRVPIPMQYKPFSVTLNFATGPGKQGKIKTVKADDLICKQNDDSK